MDLGERMKSYEESFRQKLLIRMPAVIRLDGKAFHTLTRGCEKPFDVKINTALRDATIALLDEVPARLAYLQSMPGSSMFPSATSSTTSSGGSRTAGGTRSPPQPSPSSVRSSSMARTRI
jgi:tRNA(His) 5'-end guanylyltransferase